MIEMKLKSEKGGGDLHRRMMKRVIELGLGSELGDAELKPARGLI